MSEQTRAVIQTYTGRMVDVLNLRPFDVDVRDIAHALANLCRFNGHTREFYSVAQHSVLVSGFVHLGFEEAFANSMPAQDFDRVLRFTQKAALMHDAAEAYVGDVTRPVKRALRAGTVRNGPSLSDIEDNLDTVIARAFGCTREFVPELAYDAIVAAVREADLRALSTEKRDVLKHPGLSWPDDELAEPWPDLGGLVPIKPVLPFDAEAMFLERFRVLWGEV